MRDTGRATYTYRVRGANVEPETPYGWLVSELTREGYSPGDAMSEAQRQKPEWYSEHNSLMMAAMTGDVRHLEGCRALVHQAWRDWRKEQETFAEGEERGVTGSVLTSQERQYIDANRGDASNEYARLVQVLHEAVMAEYPEMRKDVAWRLASALASKREPAQAKAEEQRVDAQVAKLGGHRGN